MNYKNSVKIVHFKKRLEDKNKRNKKLSKINAELRDKVQIIEDKVEN